MFRIIIVLAFVTIAGCRNPHSSVPADAAPRIETPVNAFRANPAFAAYWFQGKAELSVYDVRQERYGEMRPAQQVMVFVTEDFSKSKQVKLDDPGSVKTDRLPVLKLNSIRRFHTGIYDYSLEESVFSPLDLTPVAKATTSIQDWCGQVFTQVNLINQEYRVRSFSYFEQEGDSDIRLPAVLMEDEIWNRIRINPSGIDTGAVKMIPGLWYSRFRHKPVGACEARISTSAKGAVSSLLITYTDISRTLSIQYEREFPHRILSWEESFEGHTMSTGALQSSNLYPYWMQHNTSDNALRDSLHLNF